MKHLRILVCDLDGTLTDSDTIDSETWETLRRAKQAGMVLLLATGRRIETFITTGPFAELFEAIVAEDGAVLYFPRHDRTVLPFGHLHTTLLQRLSALSIPLVYGQVLVATYIPHDGPILEVLRQMGGGAVVEYNRGAVMVLPPGATYGLAFAYLWQGLALKHSNSPSIINEVVTLIEQANTAIDLATHYDIPTHNPQVQTLLGIVLLWQIHLEHLLPNLNPVSRSIRLQKARIAFETAIAQSEALIEKSKNYHQAWYTQALAYSGLALWSIWAIDSSEAINSIEPATLLTQSVATYRHAQSITNATGIIRRQKDLLLTLMALDTDNVLASLSTALENQNKVDGSST